ncbi:sialic acid TRAP transporter substrate-binding protein SiaP [Tropicimonas sp. IMCC34011]|uniref:sialic acid TRAP transporter substrate-binding protein SiaP n=1 Tax=Tropicimonas sp. IMCC34011 TaxID=2248759 RepID=UPI000E2763FC|nr:sialic acid TRAP transporter substrate-binding protein SiaP [Tropicimonas sp. IMCC34011]
MIRTFAAAALVGTTALTGAATAQDAIELKISVPSVPSDIHTRALGEFKSNLEAAMPGAFDVQIYDSGSLFGQGADVDAVERGNAELTYLSFQLIADRMPQYGLFPSPYLFRSPEHYAAVMDSEIGEEVRATVSDEMNMQLLSQCYLGTRQLNLRNARDIETPEDLAGLKLRMPSSDAWLFMGQSLGANPTPLPFGEVYLGLQTGTIDAQDNPLPTIEAAKFYEVTEQITMTGHLVDAINLVISNEVWNDLTEEQQAAVEEAGDAACAWNNEQRLSEEERLVGFFEDEGLTITEPDVDAFRTHVQQVYMDSDRSNDWPEGWVERINELAPGSED